MGQLMPFTSKCWGIPYHPIFPSLTILFCFWHVTAHSLFPQADENPLLPFYSILYPRLTAAKHSWFCSLLKFSQPVPYWYKDISRSPPDLPYSKRHVFAAVFKWSAVMLHDLFSFPVLPKHSMCWSLTEFWKVDRMHLWWCIWGPFICETNIWVF